MSYIDSTSIKRRDTAKLELTGAPLGDAQGRFVSRNRICRQRECICVPTKHMWSWRTWRRERQVRKQLEQTMKLKKRNPFASDKRADTSSSSTAGGAGGVQANVPPSLALLVQVGQQLDRRAPITLIVVGKMKEEGAWSRVYYVIWDSARPFGCYSCSEDVI